MSVYLRDIPLEDAKERLKQALEAAGLWGILSIEQISLDDGALGRVLAEPIWARISSPHYHAVAMDGFSVRAEDTVGAQPSTPVVLAYGNQAQYVDTGDPLPDEFNAVIPIENVESLDSGREPAKNPRSPKSIRIRESVTPWSHVRALGEDIVASQLVLPAGHVLRPVDLGAIAAAGHSKISVSGKPRVAILPTGSELVEIGSELKAGDIIEYNSLVLAAQVREWGGEPRRYDITPDQFDMIRKRVLEAALENDLVLVNAGSSAGSEDYSARVIEELGELLVHGIAVRPGHPVILGMIHAGKKTVPVIGVPGYPVSAALTGDIFVEPLLARWLGRQQLEHSIVKAKITRKVVSPGGDDEFMRVVVGNVNGKVLAAPISRGAGVITSLVRADGMVILPRGVQGLDAGQEVTVQLHRSSTAIEKTIFCIGSHDMTLDLLAQHLVGYDRRLSSANVGSLGGLIALKREEAHLAGSHLLDPADGMYNISYINQYLSGIRVKVYGFIDREQGLMVKRGNPKGIESLKDLAGPDIRFANRQRGAGTRVLLDYHLNLLGMSKDAIMGYNHEEFTHLGVAAAIASGRADCGLGIPAAAQSLDLDFIPLFQETYQLIIPVVHAESSLLEPLFSVLQDRHFKQDVLAMPGYDVKDMGKLIAEV